MDNEDKLREKVNEAMNVYDEYVKNANGDVADEGKAAEGDAQGESEATKA